MSNFEIARMWFKIIMIITLRPLFFIVETVVILETQKSTGTFVTYSWCMKLVCSKLEKKKKHGRLHCPSESEKKTPH